MSELLRIDGLCKSFKGVPVLDKVGMSVAEGGAAGLVGESGSGKTTLIRCLMGLETPDEGVIRYRGSDLAGGSRELWRRFRSEAQLVFQDPYSSLNPRRTVEQLVAEPLTVHRRGLDRAQRRTLVLSALERVGMDGADLLRRHPVSFSGGQRQRIAIARALVLEPHLLVCDEPVSALDVSVQAQVVNLLRRACRDLGTTLLFVAHDLAVVGHLCDTVTVLAHGRVVEQGPTGQVFTSPAEEYTRELLAAVPVPDPRAARTRRAHAQEGRTS
ncbi:MULTISPECIES: ATP-binding cassette domain-containing protein [unclassified Streptomyces]|uniref:ABC transporter ATP-binding protein n=1 Tax=unclassified Streptomyces TaxID=2593676 RepID=UPI0034293D8A